MGRICITIPPAFARDRQERDLDNGLGTWTKAGFRACLTARQLAELRSDAAFYADKDGPELSPRGVIQSAKATLRAITKATGGK